MSIAVSALVRPSPGLRLLHAGFCAAVLLSSLACGNAWLAAACAACGVAGWILGRGKATLRRIDISPVGQIRLTVQQQSGQTNGGAPALSLLAGSTLWPGLLLLRLGCAGSPRVQSVLILSDCVARDCWRPLALACHSLASHRTQ